MNIGDPAFDPLERSLGAGRLSAGDCPDADTLTAFAADTLPEGEASRIEAHLSVCGICDSLVERLRHFDEHAAGSPSEWPAIERRIWSRVLPKPRWQAILLHPGVAYGVALCVVIAAVMITRHQPTPMSPATTAPVAMEPVRTIDLNTMRGNAPTHVLLGPDDKFLVLSFAIDIHPSFRYGASLDGGPAREVVSTDGKGNFDLLFSRESLGAGVHRLTMTEISPESGKTERSFDFAFEL